MRILTPPSHKIKKPVIPTVGRNLIYFTSIDSEDIALIYSHFPGRYAIHLSNSPEFTILKISVELLAVVAVVIYPNY